MDKLELAEKILTTNEDFNPLVNFPAEKKLIILIDIVGFSKSDNREQLKTIYFFQSILMGKILVNRVKSHNALKIDHFVPTGDGCYMLADECSEEEAFYFLQSLITVFKTFETENGTKVSLRASALFGDCIPFIDLAHHKNYIGEGMNEAARILSYGQAALEKDFLNHNSNAEVFDSKQFSRNSLFLGDSLKDIAEKNKDKADNFYYFKDVEDKHGMKRNITVLQNIKEGNKE